MESVLVQSPLGPGLEYQVPYIFVEFCLQVIPCSIKSVAYHVSPSNAFQMAFRPNPMAKIASPPYSQVNVSHGNAKVNTVLRLLGQRNVNLTINLGPTSPIGLFLFSFIFLLFKLFYYFYC